MNYISRASRFCELVRPIGIAQPIDSWSSLAFVPVGLWIAYKAHAQRATNQFAKEWGYLYAFLVALIGPTSFWNHAALNRAGGTADVESMYLLASFLFLYGLSRFWRLSRGGLLALLLLLNLPLTYIASLPGPITDYVFAFLILGVIAVELFSYISHRFEQQFGYFIAALLTLLVAFAIWQLDVRGIWCNPTSFWQGHAVWHLLTALSAGLFYPYLASVRAK